MRNSRYESHVVLSPTAGRDVSVSLHRFALSSTIQHHRVGKVQVVILIVDHYPI